MVLVATVVPWKTARICLRGTPAWAHRATIPASIASDGSEVVGRLCRATIWELRVAISTRSVKLPPTSQPSR